MKLAAGEGRVGALGGQRLEPLKRGEEGGENGMNKGILGPVGGIGDFRESRVESRELGMEKLPAANEGADIEGGEEEEGDNVYDEVEKGLGGGGGGRRSGGGRRHLREGF